MGLLWHPCVITKRGANGHVQLQYGQSAALCIREGHKDQGLTHLPIGVLWVATVSIKLVVSIVVVLCVLHMLVVIAKPILAIGTHYMDSIVQVSFWHIQLVITRVVGQRQEVTCWFCCRDHMALIPTHSSHLYFCVCLVKETLTQ